MGACESTPVSRCVVHCENENQDESPIYRHNFTYYGNGGQLVSTFRSQPEANTPVKLLKGSSILYKDRKCSGERIINPDGTFGAYEWISYQEFYQLVQDYSRGLQALGLEQGDKVGIYSHNCRFWQATSYACHHSGFIPVPVYDSLGPDAAKYIAQHSEIKAIVVHRNKVDSLKAFLPETPEIKTVITINAPGTQIDGVKVISTEDVVELGKQNAHLDLIDPDPDNVGLIMYTSGSTGRPKGCVLSLRSMVAGAAGLGNIGTSIYKTDTFYSFLPLAHIYELSVEYIMIAQGTAVGFYSGSIKNLMDDLRALQPTIICAVPRVWNRIADTMREKIAGLPKIKRDLINYAIKSKVANHREGKAPSLLLEMLLFRPFKEAIGGRLRLAISGGAPILPDVYEFMKFVITPNIIQGYGLTECASCVSVQELPEWNPGNVGAISICSEMKLRKVEGLDYDPRGNPPTGEILLRGTHVFKGYYKEEELTKEVLLDGGWLATGDIAMITPNGLIQIIDRAKQLVKLSQGEYLAVTTLNDIYGRADGVQNIYVYADSHHDAPVAVVVPTQKKLAEWKSQGIEDVVNSKDAVQDIVKALGVVMEQHKLRGFERITKVAIDLEEFTVDNGCLTPSMKPQWQSLRKKYEDRIMALYQN